MHQFSAPIPVHIARPFSAGIGFCAHVPDQLDTAIFSKVVRAGKVR